MATKERVLSGMRPSGRLHLGNYLGALANWVRLQEHYDCFYFSADWHVLTDRLADQPFQLRDFHPHSLRAREFTRATAAPRSQ